MRTGCHIETKIGVMFVKTHLTLLECSRSFIEDREEEVDIIYSFKL